MSTPVVRARGHTHESGSCWCPTKGCLKSRNVRSTERTQWFVDAYEIARGKRWSASKRELCWAGGLWARAYNAKKDVSAGGGPQLDLLTAELAERRELAGIRTDTARRCRRQKARQRLTRA